MRRLALIPALLLCAVVSQASVPVPASLKTPPPPAQAASHPSQQKVHKPPIQLPAEVFGNVDPHPYSREFYPPPDRQQPATQPSADHQATAQ